MAIGVGPGEPEGCSSDPFPEPLPEASRCLPLPVFGGGGGVGSDEAEGCSFDPPAEPWPDSLPAPSVALPLASGAGRVGRGEAEDCLFDPFPEPLPEATVACVALPLPGRAGQVASGKAEGCSFDVPEPLPEAAFGCLALDVVGGAGGDCTFDLLLGLLPEAAGGDETIGRAGVPAPFLRLGWGDTAGLDFASGAVLESREVEGVDGDMSCSSVESKSESGAKEL